MKRIVMNSEQKILLVQLLKDINVNPYDFGMWLREKAEQDNDLNLVHKGLESTEVHYKRKAVLSQVEYLSVILTTK